MSTAVPSTEAFDPADLPPDAKVAVVAARFNAHIVDELLSGCLRRLKELGLDGERVVTFCVPGELELPVVAKAVVSTRRIRAVSCLGCELSCCTVNIDVV